MIVHIVLVHTMKKGVVAISNDMSNDFLQGGVEEFYVQQSPKLYRILPTYDMLFAESIIFKKIIEDVTF